MADKTVPWWRKALSFALDGLRSVFSRFAAPKPAGEAELPADHVENLEEEAALTKHSPNPEAAVAKLVKAAEPVPEAAPVDKAAEAASVSVSQSVTAPVPVTEVAPPPVAEAAPIVVVVADVPAEPVPSSPAPEPPTETCKEDISITSSPVKTESEAGPATEPEPVISPAIEEELAVLKGHDRVPSGCRAVNAEKMVGALQAAEKLIGDSKKRQGTTSVVPQMQQSKERALAPEGSVPAVSPEISPVPAAGEAEPATVPESEALSAVAESEIAPAPEPVVEPEIETAPTPEPVHEVEAETPLASEPATEPAAENDPIPSETPEEHPSESEQAAEIPADLKGYDFSRAVSIEKLEGALAPEVHLSETSPEIQPSPAAVDALASESGPAVESEAVSLPDSEPAPEPVVEAEVEATAIAAAEIIETPAIPEPVVEAEPEIEQEPEVEPVIEPAAEEVAEDLPAPDAVSEPEPEESPIAEQPADEAPEPDAPPAVEIVEPPTEAAAPTEPVAVEPEIELEPEAEPVIEPATEEIAEETAADPEPEIKPVAAPEPAAEAVEPPAETPSAPSEADAAPAIETAPAQPETEEKPAEKPPIKSHDDCNDLSPFSVIVAQVYDGPLDLLLDLIRKQDIDIYDIPISKITAQFLAYVNQLKAGDMDVAGEFIYIASLLIHIKSKMLLPRSPSGPDEAAEDPRRELVERLLEHERFKNAAQMLQQKQMLEAAAWTNPGMREFRGDEGTEPELAADTVDLVRIFRDILERARNRPMINVEEDSVTVGQMIQFLARRLTMQDKPVALRRLLSHTHSERALIAMFLALLELVRLQAILLRQDRAFSEIFIKKNTGFETVMNERLANAQDEWR